MLLNLLDLFRRSKGSLNVTKSCLTYNLLNLILGLKNIRGDKVASRTNWRKTLTGCIDCNIHIQGDSLPPRVNNFVQLAWLNFIIPGHLFASCSITKKYCVHSSFNVVCLYMKRGIIIHARNVI